MYSTPMQKEILELFVQLFVFLTYAAVGGVVAVAGVIFEYWSYTYLSSGELFVGAWIAALGVLLLSFAYLLWSDKTREAFGDLRALSLE